MPHTATGHVLEYQWIENVPEDGWWPPLTECDSTCYSNHHGFLLFPLSRHPMTVSIDILRAPKGAGILTFGVWH